jgi:superfamily I DNA/RNA helicase
LTAISEYNTFIESLISRDTTQVASCISSILPNGIQCDPHHVDDFLAIADETTLEESLDILIDKIYSDCAEKNGESKFEPAVELLTLHSSKGLTRRYVILPGLEHCWLPGDFTGADLEERKRLFLVGITRATESLLITYPRTRAPGDSLNYATAGCRQLSEFAEKLGVTTTIS